MSLMRMLGRSLLLCCLLAGPASAQDRGVITGRVVEHATGRPVPAASIDVMSQAGVVASVRADSAGYYRLVIVPAGLYAVRARSIGYVPSIADSVRVRSGFEVARDFTLGMLPMILQQQQGGEAARFPGATGGRPRG